METGGWLSCKKMSATAILYGALVVCPAQGQWLQWGGPDRNFIVKTSGLADHWPEDGPRKLWQRELGDGFSSISVDAGRLYTLYRKYDAYGQEYVVALEPKSGNTVCEKWYPAPLPPGQPQFPGPNATPLIVGDRLFTVGVNALMCCFDKRDGSILWKRDLAADFGTPLPDWGYSPSPIAYKNMVIVPVGRGGAYREQDSATDAGIPAARQDVDAGHALVALDQASSRIVWRALDFGLGHSSPMLINFRGEDQLVLYTMQGLMGVNPDTGALLWEHAFPQDRVDAVIVTPAWNGTDLLYCASFQAGCAIRLTKRDRRTIPEELWCNPKATLGMATPIFVGDFLIGPKRSQTPFLLAVDFTTGRRVWMERGVPAGPCLFADRKLITLDQDGWLGLAAVTAEGIVLHSKYQVTERLSFTPPTLAGTTLYVRDRKHIMALDLGKNAAGGVG